MLRYKCEIRGNIKSVRCEVHRKSIINFCLISKRKRRNNKMVVGEKYLTDRGPGINYSLL